MMMTNNHALSGCAAWLSISLVAGPRIHPAAVVIGSVVAYQAARFPDVDTPESRPAHQVGKFLPGLPGWINRVAGHRGITHWGITSVGVGLTLGLVASAFSPTLWWVGAATWCGWLTHILGDCLTWQGAPLLAPFTYRMVRPPYGWRFQVNGRFERNIMHWFLCGWLGVSVVATVIVSIP